MLLNCKAFSTFIFDLDGAVWRWSDLLPHAKSVIEKLSSRHKKIFFMTNNTILSRKELADKLSGFGIKAAPEQVFSAGYAAAKYLESQGVNEAYVLGESGLLKELGARNIGISEKARNVVVSIDRNFSYPKLRTASGLVNSGASFYCTGISRLWRVGNETYPAEAPLIKAIEILTGKIPKLLGMPGDVMKQRLFEDVFLFPEDAIFVGGDLEIDVAFSRRCGFKCAILPESEASLAEIKNLPPDRKPDVVLSSLLELVQE